MRRRKGRKVWSEKGMVEGRREKDKGMVEI